MSDGHRVPDRLADALNGTPHSEIWAALQRPLGGGTDGGEPAKKPNDIKPLARAMFGINL